MISAIAADQSKTAGPAFEMGCAISERSIWNDYWHFDRLSSFDEAINYGEEIAAGWNAFFATLPGGASILDLCTGNGAIAVMAAETGRRENKLFRIAAVDSADINPCLHVTKRRDELATIEFKPATLIEHLPWPAASFDAVVSQYGVEYSDLSQSIPELARVVTSGGKVRLVLHAANGAVVQQSKRAVADIIFLLHEVDLAGKAQRCLRAVAAIERGMDRSERAHCAARESTEAFRDALREIGRRLAGAADPAVLRNSGQMLAALFRRRSQYDVAQAIGVIEGIRAEWRNHKARLVAQIEAAVTRQGRADIADLLRKSGARKVEESDQMDREALIGHCIEAFF